MNPSRIFTVLALTSLAACQKAPLLPSNDPKLDSRLAKIEAQLYRVEEALVRLSEAEASREGKVESAAVPAAAEEPAALSRISVYVYGESVPRPGEQAVVPGGTVMMALASAGGPGAYTAKKLTVVRKEKPDIDLEGQEEWKNFTVEEGDVIVVKASVF